MARLGPWALVAPVATMGAAMGAAPEPVRSALTLPLAAVALVALGALVGSAQRRRVDLDRAADSRRTRPRD